MGIRTAAPTAALDVNGSTRLRGLTTAGFVTTDASGNLGSVVGSGSFVQNHTATVQAGGFNLNGSGAVGGALVAGGTVAVDAANANDGTAANFLRFGESGSAEGIGSKRTVGGNRYGVDFYTNGVARLSVANGGNVGIGTTAPTAALDVNGGARLRGLTTSGVVTTDASGNLSSGTGSGSFIQNQTATAQAGGFNLSGSGTVGGTVTVDAANANTGTAASFLRFGTSGSGEGIGSKRTAGGNFGGLDFYTAGTNRLSVASGGNVGIRTTAPTAALDVNGTTRLRGLDGAGVVLADIDGNLSTNPFGYIQNQAATVQPGGFNLSDNGRVSGTLTAGGTVGVDAADFNDGTATNFLRFGAIGSGEGIGSKRTPNGNRYGLDFYTNSTSRLSIASGGNVGIGLGTNTATAPLDVNGSARLRGNLRRDVRLCPVNTTSATYYTLTAADIAFDVFKVANGAYARGFELPAAGSGQQIGQELTIYNVATSSCIISNVNTDNPTTPTTLQDSNTAGLHAVKFIWDGVWIRVQ